MRDPQLITTGAEATTINRPVVDLSLNIFNIKIGYSNSIVHIAPWWCENVHIIILMGRMPSNFPYSIPPVNLSFIWKSLNYLSERTLWGHISMPLLCRHHIWPSLESFTRENSSSQLEFDTLFSGTILPMDGQAPECILLGSLNWIFLTLGKNRKSVMPKKAILVSLLVNAALEKETSSWVQSMQMRQSYSSWTSSSRI